MRLALRSIIVNITEVRIKLMDDPGDRLKAFCSVTFDNCFVVRDLKIIEGTNGPFVAMPSRKLTAHCGKCGMKNHLRANHCNQCGGQLEEGLVIKDADGRTKLYADIAHPINSQCREMIQARIVSEFHDELERAKSPDYASRYDDYDGGDFTADDAAATRRFDEAHGHHASNRPHHPPQGDAVTAPPPRVPFSGPHTSKSGSVPITQGPPTQGPATQSDAPISENLSGGAHDFGSGIF